MSEQFDKSVKPNGVLWDTDWYLAWTPGNREATLDGEFTSAELRQIASHMEAEMYRLPVRGPTETHGGFSNV